MNSTVAHTPSDRQPGPPLTPRTVSVITPARERAPPAGQLEALSRQCIPGPGK